MIHLDHRYYSTIEHFIFEHRLAAVFCKSRKLGLALDDSIKRHPKWLVDTSLLNIDGSGVDNVNIWKLAIQQNNPALDSDDINSWIYEVLLPSSAQYDRKWFLLRQMLEECSLHQNVIRLNESQSAFVHSLRNFKSYEILKNLSISERDILSVCPHIAVSAADVSGVAIENSEHWLADYISGLIQRLREVSDVNVIQALLQSVDDGSSLWSGVFIDLFNRWKDLLGFHEVELKDFQQISFRRRITLC